MNAPDEELERRIRGAGRVELAPETVRALDELVTARLDGSGREARRRQRRRLALTGGLTVALLSFGGAAVAASDWRPWDDVPEPDWVLARDWVDANGDPVGSCESRTALSEYPAEMEAAYRGYLEALDTDALEPDPRWVAIHLETAGRLDELSRLVPGADPGDHSSAGDSEAALTEDPRLYGASGLPGAVLPPDVAPFYSDARILQNALEMAAFEQAGAALRAEFGDYLLERYGTADYVPLSGSTQTQCTTDPGYAQRGAE